MTPRRSAALLALAFAGSALTACGSVGAGPSAARRESSSRRERAGFVVASSGWISGAMNAVETADDPGRGHAASPSGALSPTAPWLGTLGICGRVPGSYEYGLGVCVPNPNAWSSWRDAQQGAPDPLRQLAVGVWLKFDF